MNAHGQVYFDSLSDIPEEDLKRYEEAAAEQRVSASHMLTYLEIDRRIKELEKHASKNG
jgi:hypothetical protein